MNKEQRMIACIDNCQNEMIELWRDFVNQDSGSADKAGIDSLQKQVKTILETMGAKVKLLEFAQAGALLVAEIPGNPKMPVLFSGHIDTVFPKGTTKKRPFALREGKAYGPGVLDMKGGIVAFLYAIKALQSIGFQDRPIKVLLAGDEEPGHPFSNAAEIFLKEASGCVAAFNCESGFVDNGIVVGRKGVGYFTLEVQGVACHFGNDPENGRSAIREIAYKVIELEKLTNLDRGVSVNVGVISGGTVSNAAPDYAKAQIDLRCKDEADMPFIVAALQEIATKQYVEGTRTTLSGDIRFPGMKTTVEVSRLFSFIKELSFTYGFPEPYPKFCGGGADSALLVKAGVPTLCGMGVKGGRNHSSDEFALVESLFERAKLLALTVLNIDKFLLVK